MTAARRTARASCCTPRASSPTAARGSTSSSTRRIALFTRIDRRRKLPVTILLRALGYNNEEMLNMFFEHQRVHPEQAGRRRTGAGARAPARRNRRFDIRIGDKLIVEAGKRITARHVRDLRAGPDRRAGSAGRIPARPHPRARRGRPEDRRTAGGRQRRVERRPSGQVPQGRHRDHRHAVRERPRPRPVHLARPCASTRPARRSRRWSRSTA
jgi:hypothetical protein